MLWKYSGLVLALCIAAQAEIIDRIAVTVGTTVITESEVLRQMRLIAFQNHEKPDFSPEKRRAAAEKLVEQTLIRREIEVNRYSKATPADVEKTLKELKASYGSEQAFRKALASYGL